MTAVWPRLRAAWVTLTGTGAVASVAFGLLVFVSLLASLAIPRESVGLRNGAVRQVIAASQLSDRTIIGTEGEALMPDAKGWVLARDIASVGALFQARLAAGGVAVASDPVAWAGLTTGYVPVSGTAQATGNGQPQLQLNYRTALGRYSQVAAGRLPAGLVAGRRDVVEAAVTTTIAAKFGLRIGSRLTAGPVQLLITGIIRPVDQAAAFWRDDLVATSPALTQAAAPRQPYWIGAAFIGPGALPLVESMLGTDEMNVTWVYTAALGGLTAGQAGGVEATVAGLAAGGATVVSPVVVSPVTGNTMPVTISVDSAIPSILSPFLAAQSAAAPVLELLYVSLAIVGALVVLLGARLVGQRRTAEFTLMRARGAALYQLGWLVLRASLVITVAAGAAATALAACLTPGDDDTASWWLAGLTIAVTLFGPVLISVVPQRVASPVTGRAAGRRAAGRGLASRRVVSESALAALAIGGLAVLRNEGLSTGNSGVYTSAAPVLIAIPVAIVMLRCYPPAARQLARLAGLSRGAVAFVGLARATRTPAGIAAPAFALVLVLAMMAFPDMISTSVTQSQVAASWQQVGADAIIVAPSSGDISPALQSQVSSVPGVVSTASGVVDDESLPSGYELPVLWVDPAQYAAVVDQAPGPRFPVAALSATSGAVPVAATPAAAQLIGTTPVSLGEAGSSVTIRLAGQIDGAPGVAGNAVVVAPLRALGHQAPPPNLLLVAGPRLDAARLTAVVRGGLPGGSVSLRSTALSAMTTAPVLQAARAALTQAMDAAAGFGALILLLLLLLTARSREMTLAYLATMGLRRWQAQLLLAIETLPPVVAAAIGGVACAWLLVPLIGPSLNLAAFSGTGSAIVVTPAVAPLAGSAAGLMLAALLVLAVQAVLTYQRGSARALRIAD
jgi:putative ABC transport system permease protein